VYYDSSNKIDARIISKRNGIFIDITFLTKTNMRFGYINCKSPHYYKFIDILPLKKTIFEGCELYVPNNYKKMFNTRIWKKCISSIL